MKLFNNIDVKKELTGEKTAISVYMSVDEKNVLRELADNENLALSNFIKKCINCYVNPDVNNSNSDDVVDEVDYLMDYADNNLPSHFTCDGVLTKREGYYVDDDGYEYFMGEHVEMDYTDPIELRRTPDKYIEFRLLDDDRGFVRACYDIWNINHLT